MAVIPDFKTPKVIDEFHKAFGGRIKPPKPTLKVLIESVSLVVQSGPATCITGSPEQGLVVKVVSSATGKRVLHCIRLDEDFRVIGHDMKYLGDPLSSTTVSAGDLSAKIYPRKARSQDLVIERKLAPHSD